jgi:hypothetical protein
VLPVRSRWTSIGQAKTTATATQPAMVEIRVNGRGPRSQAAPARPSPAFWWSLAADCQYRGP